jgi:hypothetical protein
LDIALTPITFICFTFTVIDTTDTFFVFGTNGVDVNTNSRSLNIYGLRNGHLHLYQR